MDKPTKLEMWMRGKGLSDPAMALRTRFCDPQYRGVSSASIGTWRRGSGVNIRHAFLICQATNFAINVHDLVPHDWLVKLRHRGGTFFAASRKGARRLRPPA